MRRTATGIAACLALACMAGAAAADEEAELVVEGQPIVTKLEAPEGHPLPVILSGWRFREDETQALQTDDFENPGFLEVDAARELWTRVEGAAGKSCADCHGAVEEGMKGVRAAMPKWNETAGEVWSMENHINDCRVNRMQAEAWDWEKNPMVGMTALIGLQSRGLPMQVDVSGAAEEWFKRGEEIYYTRYGQLELSCANCHEDHWGDMIRADHLSQGQVNGFPTYRLRDTRLVALHQRFRGCIRDTRGETFAAGSPEFRALELYVAWRGQGLGIETPSVRQ